MLVSTRYHGNQGSGEKQRPRNDAEFNRFTRKQIFVLKIGRKLRVRNADSTFTQCLNDRQVRKCIP